MAVGESTAMESASAVEEEEATHQMIEDNDDVLIPEDMKRFLNEQYQHTIGGVSTGRGKRSQSNLGSVYIGTKKKAFKWSRRELYNDHNNHRQRSSSSKKNCAFAFAFTHYK